MISNKKLLRQSVLTFLLAGCTVGFNAMNVQADVSGGHVQVRNPGTVISDSIQYGGKTGGNNPTSIIKLYGEASGGTVTLAPENKEITGTFTTGHEGLNKTANASGIELMQGAVNTPGYEGVFAVADDTKINVKGNGSRISGAVIMNAQSEAGTNTIELGKNVSLSYTVEGDSTNSELYGIYNRHGNLETDEGYKQYLWIIPPIS